MQDFYKIADDEPRKTKNNLEGYLTHHMDDEDVKTVMKLVEFYVSARMRVHDLNELMAD